MTNRVLLFSFCLSLSFICTISSDVFGQDSSEAISGVNFYFPKNAYRPIVSEGIESYLKELKAYVDKNEDVQIKLDGYAQDGKNEEWNTRVSKYRVRAMRDILIDYGISKSRIEIEYFGKTGFIAEDDSAKELAKNRRVELRIDSDS